MSLKFGQICLRTAELVALERLKIDAATFSWLLFIRSILNLYVSRTCIISRRSSNFGQIGPLTMELIGLEHLKIPP